MNLFDHFRECPDRPANKTEIKHTSQGLIVGRTFINDSSHVAYLHIEPPIPLRLCERGAIETALLFLCLVTRVEYLCPGYQKARIATTALARPRKMTSRQLSLVGVPFLSLR